jgi:hypothetical protein
MFKKVDSEFPIFIWSNFLTLDKKTRTDLMNIVLENKKKSHHGVGGSFKIDYDPTSLWKFYVIMIPMFFFINNI